MLFLTIFLTNLLLPTTTLLLTKLLTPIICYQITLLFLHGLTLSISTQFKPTAHLCVHGITRQSLTYRCQITLAYL